jgi:cell division protein FtsZ
MAEGGVAMIGVGESDSTNRAVESVEKAINNPLLDVNIEGAKGALIVVSGGPTMSLDEAKKVIEIVSKKLSDDAKINWGAQISNDLHDTIRTLLIVTGVESPQIFGKQKTMSYQKRKEVESELGISFLED